MSFNAIRENKILAKISESTEGATSFDDMYHCQCPDFRHSLSIVLLVCNV